MAFRYAKGLVLAFLLLGAMLGATMFATALVTGRPGRPSAFLDRWVFFGLLTLALLAICIGPMVLALRGVMGEALTVVRAAVVGAAAGPVLLFAIWLLTREQNESVGGLLQFWWRSPLGFVLGALPQTAASGFFAGCLVAGKRRSRDSAARAT